MSEQKSKQRVLVGSKASALLRAKAVEIAIGYLDQREVPKGSNWGPFVERCLKSIGINYPQPWCQAFVHLIYEEAAALVMGGVANPVVRTGGVLRCWTETSCPKLFGGPHLVENVRQILPGYQVIIDFGIGQFHTCIVEFVQGTVLHTIEGNTNDEGSREGFEVCRRTRDVARVKGIICY